MLRELALEVLRATRSIEVLRSAGWRLGHGLVRCGHRLLGRRTHYNAAQQLASRLERMSRRVAALLPRDGNISRGFEDYLDQGEARAVLQESLVVATLHDRLARLTAAAPLTADGSLNDPLPIDGQGVLREAHGTVDIVVCIHDALDDVRRCLWSLLSRTAMPFHLILVNDGSDRATTDFLRAFAAAHPTVELLERPHPPHGYTLAANLGLASSRGDYVVFLNSDTS